MPFIPTFCPSGTTEMHHSFESQLCSGMSNFCQSLEFAALSLCLAGTNTFFQGLPSWEWSPASIVPWDRLTTLLCQFGLKGVKCPSCRVWKRMDQVCLWKPRAGSLAYYICPSRPLDPNFGRTRASISTNSEHPTEVCIL